MDKIIKEKKNIENSISKFEKNTSCELIVVIAKKSDPYNQAAWRGAFLISTILSSGIIFSGLIHDLFWFYLIHIVQFIILLEILPLMNADRYFCHRKEINRETEEKAQEAFLRFHQKHNLQRSVLFFLSLWERKIQILVGEELKYKLSENELEKTIQTLIPEFKKSEFPSGIIKGIQFLEEKIIEKAPSKTTFESSVDNHIHFI